MNDVANFANYRRRLFAELAVVSFRVESNERPHHSSWILFLSFFFSFFLSYWKQSRSSAEVLSQPCSRCLRWTLSNRLHPSCNLLFNPPVCRIVYRIRVRSRLLLDWLVVCATPLDRPSSKTHLRNQLPFSHFLSTETNEKLLVPSNLISWLIYADRLVLRFSHYFFKQNSNYKWLSLDRGLSS